MTVALHIITAALLLGGLYGLLCLMARIWTIALAVPMTFAAAAIPAIAIGEGLSALHILTEVWLTVIASVLSIAVIITAVLTRSWRHPEYFLAAVGRQWRGSSWVGRLALLFIGILAIVTFVTGVATAPNNIDSLAYHLPKVEQAFQNSTLGDFATPYPAQYYLSAGAEIMTAWLLAIFGSDHFMFLGQWTAGLATALAIFRASRNLGASTTSSWVAGAFLLSAPLVIGESATTQNDLVATAFVALTVALISHRAEDHGRAAALAVAPATACATLAVKPTAALILAPVIVWAVARIISHGKEAIIGALIFSIVSVGALNVGWAIRNDETFGRLTGPDLGLTVSGNPGRALAANSIKNLGPNLALPLPEGKGSALGSINSYLSEGLKEASEAVSGVDVDDPRYSFTQGYSLDSERNEDRAANVVQFVVTIVILFLVALHPRSRRLAWIPAVLLLASYALFSAVVCYQTWIGRLMLPLLALSSVGLALAITPLKPKVRGVLALLVVAGCALQCLPWLVAQKWRPLVGGSSVIKTDDARELLASVPPEERAGWIDTAAHVRSHAREDSVVALAGEHSYVHEYWWWRMACPDETCRIIHIDVDNATRKYEDRTKPDFIIAPTDKIKVHDGYQVSKFGTVTLERAR